MRIKAHTLSVLYLLTLALLFNAVAPALAYAGGSGNSASTNKVLLCTSKGYQWVSLSAQLEQNTLSEATSNHCVQCIGGDNVADSALIHKVDVHLIFFSAEPLSLTDHYPLLKSRFMAQLANSRAPPQV